jgi:hypothetical protein
MSSMHGAREEPAGESTQGQADGDGELPGREPTQHPAVQRL